MSVPGRPTQQGPANIDEVMELVRHEGGRASTARRVILEALVAAGGHRTAEELAADIHSSHPEIHQTTVYRNLERFEDLGVAYHTHLGHGPAQWHLSGSRHQHLVCQHCGAVIEADPDILTALEATLHERSGFDLDLRHFAITGTCQSCASEARESPHQASSSANRSMSKPSCQPAPSASRS